MCCECDSTETGVAVSACRPASQKSRAKSRLTSERTTPRPRARVYSSTTPHTARIYSQKKQAANTKGSTTPILRAHHSLHGRYAARPDCIQTSLGRGASRWVLSRTLTQASQLNREPPRARSPTVHRVGSSRNMGRRGAGCMPWNNMRMYRRHRDRLPGMATVPAAAQAFTSAFFSCSAACSCASVFSTG